MNPDQADLMIRALMDIHSELRHISTAIQYLRDLQ